MDPIRGFKSIDLKAFVDEGLQIAWVKSCFWFGKKDQCGY